MTATRTRPGPADIPPAPTDTPANSVAGGRGRYASIAADLGLLALAFGTTAAFTRLFDDWSFLTRLALPLIAAWGIALVLRRTRVPTLPSAAIHLGIGVVLLTVMFGRGTGLFGLPTPETFRMLSTSVDTSFSEFSRLVAPVAPNDGFLVVIAAALWVFAFFADTAAFRYGGPVQAAVPYLSTFLATGILARDSGRVAASIYFVGGLILYAITERTLQASRARWVGSSQRTGARAVAVSALGLGVLALVGGLALGPFLPGSSQPVIDLRDVGQGSGPRTVISPFVGLRSLLGVRSDAEMFTVRSEQPAYWRLTALEQYDSGRDIWVSHGSYQHADGTLDSNLDADIEGSPLRQDIRISGLSGLWLPGAYEPSDYVGDTEVNYDRESASIIRRQDRTGVIGYQLESLVPDLDAARGARAGTARDVDEEYLETADVSDEVAEMTRRITDNGNSDFDRALLLQAFFRDGFEYDESVDYREEDDPLTQFLQERRGFCQQFSSAFALMARSIGLPSRVAVGFTPGDPVDAATASGADTSLTGAADVQYVVRGRHAHAWPEIYFRGVGWVPFEPTPGRGDPQSSELTGVPSGQATPPPAQAATTTSTAAPGQDDASTATTPSTLPGDVNATVDPDAARESPAGGSRSWMVAAALLLIAAVALAIAVTRRTRRPPRHHSTGQSGRIGDAWQRAELWLAMVGVRAETWETPTEFAQRAVSTMVHDDAGADDASTDDAGAVAHDDHVSEVSLDGLLDLALAETARRFGGGEPSAEMCQRAEQAAEGVEAFVRHESSRRQRLEQRLRG